MEQPIEHGEIKSKQFSLMISKLRWYEPKEEFGENRQGKNCDYGELYSRNLDPNSFHVTPPKAHSILS